MLFMDFRQLTRHNATTTTTANNNYNFGTFCKYTLLTPVDFADL